VQILIAEYEFRSTRSNTPSSARISPGSGGTVGGPGLTQS